MNKNALIIFAKFPEEGNVKTRLAATAGSNTALMFYKLCAENLFKQAAKCNAETFLFFDPTCSVEKIKDWVKYDFNFHPQLNSGLGERMLEAFRIVFCQNFEKVIIAGTDVPDLTTGFIDDAFTSLQENDLTISPSPDGGYNLLGMKKLHEKLFKNIEWSTPEVLPKTLSAANSLNLKVNLLDELIDIDTEDELNDWLSSKQEGNPELKILIEKIIKR